MVKELSPAIASSAREAKEKLRARFGERLREVVLFGSYAWGAPSAESDVDLCVVIDELTHSERSAAMEIVAEVGLERDVQLAPLVWSADELGARLAHEQALALDIRKRGMRL